MRRNQPSPDRVIMGTEQRKVPPAARVRTELCLDLTRSPIYPERDNNELEIPLLPFYDALNSSAVHAALPDRLPKRTAEPHYQGDR